MDFTGGEQRPHVVIVGAGISGLAVAALLDREAVDVTVLDQAMSPGRKCDFAGIVSATDLRSLGIALDTGVACPVVNIAHYEAGALPLAMSIPPEDWYTVQHGPLLDTLRASITARGVSYVPDASVNGFLWNAGIVSGVTDERSGRSYRADVTVLADESNPRLAEALGLRPDWSPTQLMHVGKRRYEARLPTTENQHGDGGVVHAFEQVASWGSPGWGMIVPARDAITVAVAMSLEEAMVSTRHISEYLGEVVRSSPLREWLEGLPESAMMTEVVPIGGFEVRNRFHTGGVIVASDLVGVTNPLNRDGFSENLAVCSVAARAIADAAASGDFSERALKWYSDGIFERLVSPINAARRSDRTLRAQPPWLWAAKPDLFAFATGVTERAKPATLTRRADQGALARVRAWGRSVGVRRHPPGASDE